MKIHFTVVIVAMLLFVSIAFPREQTVNANFSGYVVGDTDGKHIVLNLDITPLSETTCLTVRLKWNGNIFSLEHHNVSSDNANIKEFEDGIVLYFSQGAQKIELTLIPINSIPFEAPISMDVFTLPSPKDNTSAHLPSVSALHKEISLDSENSSDNIATVPQDIVLRQNLPNPFNSSTVLEYGIPQKSDVRLSIYDVMGREICNLINCEMNAGFYRASWNGKDSHGSSMSSGIYFVKLKVGDEMRTMKMQFLK
ncbi:T9SS type A sorting domain-containing protein [bacterium]|nr:T9SS type A sorting domain-containing protein [bacterium]